MMKGSIRISVSNIVSVRRGVRVLGFGLVTWWRVVIRLVLVIG